ncbi:MAG: hypothetical protein KDD02_14525 [Phaeodactylibacter sp.]|nr:hypothetical protein [Phaeodactylibacter sp.]MCB9302663.1 hypothetical protein [Lewinellaceae bacterium]
MRVFIFQYLETNLCEVVIEESEAEAWARVDRRLYRLVASADPKGFKVNFTIGPRTIKEPFFINQNLLKQ